MRFLLIFILGFISINSYSQIEFIKNTFQGPQNVRIFHDYEMGMSYAQKNNKLVLYDFYACTCAYWSKIKSLVWGDLEVLKILREKLIVISLFVDHKTKLPISEHKIVNINSREINVTTHGSKRGFIQMSEYKTKSQTYYVM
tara:strand:- start:5158 stop:5583 length:426 start_codon:yes stop_codon:yes gene_type:complete